jgi:predicted nucleic acid-binding protein
LIWLADTSAWARRAVPEIAAQLDAILDEDPANEFALTGPVLIELLREPHGHAVASARAEHEAALSVLSITKAVQDAALDAMTALAAHSPDGHRLPIADLLTAASAHHYGCGIVHIDGDFEALAAEHSGLRFQHRRLRLPDNPALAADPAARQRALRKALNQRLHALPIADAERLLEQFIADAAG